MRFFDLSINDLTLKKKDIKEECVLISNVLEILDIYELDTYAIVGIHFRSHRAAISFTMIALLLSIKHDDTQLIFHYTLNHYDRSV